MLLSNLVAWQVERGVVRLTWRIEDSGWYAVSVYRKVNEDAEERIAVVNSAEQYVDRGAPTGSIIRKLTYSIAVDGYDDRLRVDGAGFTTYDPYAIEITRRNAVALSMVGRPGAVFCKKWVGGNCDCYDALAEIRTRSNCKRCGNTGVVVGYAAPVVCSFLFGTPTNKAMQPQDFGDNEDNRRSFWTDTAVWIKPRDVVVMASGKRYRAGDVTTTDLGDTACRQIVPVVEIDPTDVEYDLKVPEETLAEMARRRVAAMAALG